MVEKTKTKCPKCGKVKVMMTWRPTMVGSMALIDECESCHFRPRSDGGAWGFGGEAVPIHYGKPPHDMQLKDIVIKCTKCKVECDFKEVELPSEVIANGGPIWWQCPTCTFRVGLKQVIDRFNEEACK